MADADDDLDPKASDDEGIIKEAKKRFAAAESWESDARKRFVEDLKFVHGDAVNNWQWPDDIYTSRTGGDSKRPCLTINKAKQHANQVVNSAKQNKISVSIHPTGDEATAEAAETFEGLVRQIEYHSRASDAYDKAAEFQTYGGIGYIRVATDYVANDTFDQDLFIKRCNNPLSIYMDPDAKEADKSDAGHAFEFDDMPVDRFKAKHPKHADKTSQTSLGTSSDDWLTKDHVRVVRYWRRTQKPDKLVHLVDPKSGQESFVPKSQIAPEIWKLVEPSKPQMRDILSDTVEWFEIGADAILDRGKWLGKYIPIVPVIWEEIVVEGKMDRKGLVRALIHPQQMYNYNTSAAVEGLALQSKTPYIGPMAAFEGFQKYWEMANKENIAWLPTNHVDEQGRDIPQPTRQQPPALSDGYVKSLDIAKEEMMMATGQYQAQMGQNENAKSGIAISARQRQGDNATYQGIDGLAIAVRQVGRILVDMIPKIYDTKRVLNILAEDGERSSVSIDPHASDAVQKKTDAENNQATIIFNPNVGRYSVQSDVGPNFATQREEAFNAYSQIMANDHDLMKIAGDIMVKNMDTPGADELAERLRRMVPPEALGTAPPPAVAEMQQQMANLQKVLSHMAQQLADKDMKLKAKDQQKDIDAFDAESRRITALGNSGPAISPEEIKPLVAQVIGESLGTPMGPVVAAGAPTLASDTALPATGAPGAPPTAPDQPPAPLQQQPLLEKAA